MWYAVHTTVEEVRGLAMRCCRSARSRCIAGDMVAPLALSAGDESAVMLLDFTLVAVLLVAGERTSTGGCGHSCSVSVSSGGCLGSGCTSAAAAASSWLRRVLFAVLDSF